MFISILSSGSRCLDLRLETSGTCIFPFVLSVLTILSFFCLHSDKKKVKITLISGKRWLQFFFTKKFGYFLHLV